MNPPQIPKNRKALKHIDDVNTYFNIFYRRGILHGVQFLGQPVLHIIEKLLWLAIIISSFYFCALLSLDSWHHLQNANTVVTLETDHYYWKTPFPALTICPMSRINESLYDNYCMAHGISGQTKTELYQFLVSLANATYFNFQDIKTFPSIEKFQFNPKDYIHLILNLTDDPTLILKPSDDIHKVTVDINGVHMLTVQVLTEYGICYTTNSFISQNLSIRKLLYDEDYDKNNNPHYRNQDVHEVSYGNLFYDELSYSFIGFLDNITAFIHSSRDVLNLAKPAYYCEEIRHIKSSVLEIKASEEFRESTTIRQRKCRFNSESELVHFKVYSKELCYQECRINLAMKLCHCIPHFYPNAIPNPKPVCSYMQLKECFPQYTNLFLQFRNNDGSEIKCYCEPNCADSIIMIDELHFLHGTKNVVNKIGILLSVVKYSQKRFVRKVLYTVTDFFVSIGGAAGLLLGFSVLGIVEILYFFSLRLYWYIMGRR